MHLENQTALVAGAGSGIGRATAAPGSTGPLMREVTSWQAWSTHSASPRTRSSGAAVRLATPLLRSPPGSG